VLGALYGEFARLFPEVFDPVELPHSEVLVVYVFDGADRYRRLTRAREIDISFFDVSSRRTYLTTARDTALESLFHDGTHQLVNCMLTRHGRDEDVKEGKVPLWIDAGLACRNEGFRRDAEGKFVFAGLSLNYLPAAQRAIDDRLRRVTLREVLSLKTGDLREARKKPDEEFRLDSLCWAAVYFFMDGAGGKRRKDFLTYCTQEWTIGAGVEGAEKLLGDLDALDKEWKELVQGLK